ncbi:MAG: hypothetical protein AAF915_19100 [Cyanobacteria bacterium P01_D01_bin.50]
MFTQTSNVTNNLAVSLLTHYSFDLGGYVASELVKRWEKQYPSNWVHLAVIEALYQGRYKAVSVQQILTLWLRRNHPSYHFNFEFERLICNNLPQDLKWNSLPPALPAVNMNNDSTIKEAMRNYQLSQTVNSSHQRNLQSQQAIEEPVEANNYHTPELVSAEAEEDFNAQNVSKALPASSGMVLSTSKSQTSTIRNPASPTLTEIRNHIITDSASKELEQKQLKQSESSEKPLIRKTLAKLLPPARNHPPIEQFTPEKNDTSETFTSKLKAIVTEK